MLLFLFNDGHILHLRSEIVAVHGRMNMVLIDFDGQLISEDRCGSNFLTFVIQFKKNPVKNLNLDICPTGDHGLCSFSNLSVTSPMSQLSLQPFRCFTYVTAHSPTIISLLLRHSIFTFVTWRAAHAGDRTLDHSGCP